MSEQPERSALRVATSELRWRCDVGSFDFETTADIEPLSGMIGQDEAIEALRFGLEIYAPGQNVFVRGLSGTGRMSLVGRLLKEIQPACPLAGDYAYVANFDSPGEPRLLSLPRGCGAQFRDALEELIEFLRNELAAAMSSDDLRQRKQILEERFKEEAKAIAGPFDEELQQNGLVMHTATVGSTVRPVLLPVIEGEPAPPERIHQLVANGQITDENIEEINGKIEAFSKRLESISIEMQRVRAKHVEHVQGLFRSEARSLLDARCQEIRVGFPQDDVAAFLDGLAEEVVRQPVEELGKDERLLQRFHVNLILGHRAAEDCPVIVENTPTLSNLLGSIDRRVLPEGVAISDHTMISAGSLLRADGGYLILEAREVLSEPGAWKVLVRTLRTGMLEIVPPEMSGPWGMRTLKPQAIPIKIKVILIGDPGLYHALDAQDPDFPDLFKVLADFETTISTGADTLTSYARLFARVARDENLPHYQKDAIAALAEHGARVAGRHDRLTTRFGRLVDIAREAAFLTSKSSERFVTGDRVREAVKRTRRRANLPARRFRESIAEGTIRIQTEGQAIGQVNGLAVVSTGPLTYGFPTRITATIGAGHAGMINIERESQLSGAIHTKGFHILGGLLRHLLRTEHPLAFSASIAFEQSYGGIDGDSASGAEMCCLLSALTGRAMRQDLAMTGAIDQHGRILPIGAATEKIEGYFEVCRAQGFTGTQGVILPSTNVKNLMLRDDVVSACHEGTFHVYAVDDIREAFELFMGIPAGERGDNGEYPEGSLLGLAVEKAFEYWTLASAHPVWEEASVEDAEALPNASPNPEPTAETPEA